MKVLLAIILTVHGLIHLMGFAKAFGHAQLEALKLPISKPMGVLWLLAALLTLVAVAMLFTTPRWWWLAFAASVVLSQGVIVSSWSDAKFGTVANVIALAAAVVGFFNFGPTSLRADYESRVARGLARRAPQPVVTEADLAALPAPVATYLRRTGAVGQPRVQSLRARWTGRLRADASSDWMPIEVEQVNFLDEPSRFFFLVATKDGLPAVGLHAYEHGEAGMRVKLLSMVPLVDASGPGFTRAETVTVLNDMALLAPSSLLSPALRWEPVSPTEARVTFTTAGQAVTATLLFDASGDLVNFWSDDRPALAKDNVHFEPMRWSTPVHDYQPFGPFRLASVGEARYAAPTGEYAYAELRLESLTVDVAP